MTQALEMHVGRAGDASALHERRRRLEPLDPGRIRVRVEAAGVAYADIVLRRGVYPSARPPVTPGYDVVGRVAELGPAVTGLEVGQRVAAVIGHGGYADVCDVPAAWAVPAPDAADPVALVAVALNGVTAWQMLHRVAAVSAGDRVLVHGAAGGVGSLLLDLARLAGVAAVGTASAGKLDTVADRGGLPLDRTRRDLVAAVRDATAGGVTAAFDHVGGRHFRSVTLPALRDTGVGVLYGGYDATRDGRVRPLALADLLVNGGLSTLRLFSRSIGAIGYGVTHWRDNRPEAFRADLARVLELVADGSITPLVGATYRLTEAAAAHRALETRAVTGKIVLVP